MTQRERATAERDAARDYEGLDAFGAFMGWADWEAELTFIAEDEAA